MKRFLVAVMIVIGLYGYAFADDVLEQDLKILVDQYAAASGPGDTQSFASNFRSYMIGSDRLGKAAEQQRRIYEFSFDTSISKFQTVSDKRSGLVAKADYLSKKNGQAVAKGEVTATYAVRQDKLVLVMVKFSDEVVRYKDAERIASEKTQEKEKEKKVIFFPGSNPAPDFSTGAQQELEI